MRMLSDFRRYQRLEVYHAHNKPFITKWDNWVGDVVCLFCFFFFFVPHLESKFPFNCMDGSSCLCYLFLQHSLREIMPDMMPYTLQEVCEESTPSFLAIVSPLTIGHLWSNALCWPVSKYGTCIQLSTNNPSIGSVVLTACSNFKKIASTFDFCAVKLFPVWILLEMSFDQTWKLVYNCLRRYICV